MWTMERTSGRILFVLPCGVGKTQTWPLFLSLCCLKPGLTVRHVRGTFALLGRKAGMPRSSRTLGRLRRQTSNQKPRGRGVSCAARTARGTFGRTWGRCKKRIHRHSRKLDPGRMALGWPSLLDALKNQGWRRSRKLDPGRMAP